MIFAFDALLAAVTIVAALRVLSARDSFAAVIAFIAFGLVLTLAWVCLSAIDVALTEAAVGSGITGFVLVRAASRITSRAERSASAPLRITAAILCTLVFGGLAAVVLLLPEPAPTLAPEAAWHLATTGLGNPVTAVLLVYRALDTFLETVVLLVALVGIWSLANSSVAVGTPARLGSAVPSGALTFLARILAPVGVVIAVYVVWAGADAPGGKFQGAAVLCAIWLLLLLSGLQAPPDVGGRPLRVLLLVGPTSFFAVGLLGFALAGGFLVYPPGYEKPIVLFIEAVLTISVTATLGLLVLGPPQERHSR